MMTKKCEVYFAWQRKDKDEKLVYFKCPTCQGRSSISTPTKFTHCVKCGQELELISNHDYNAFMGSCVTNTVCFTSKEPNVIKRFNPSKIANYTIDTPKEFKVKSFTCPVCNKEGAIFNPKKNIYCYNCGQKMSFGVVS